MSCLQNAQEDVVCFSDGNSIHFLDGIRTDLKMNEHYLCDFVCLLLDWDLMKRRLVSSVGCLGIGYKTTIKLDCITDLVIKVTKEVMQAQARKFH